MKHKFSHRTINQSYNRRPTSAVIKHPYLNSSQSSGGNYDNSSEILFTTPSYSKGFGNNIEKEKLYEQTIQLKTQVNKLTKELAETKSNNVKLDIELRKKENIIKTIVEENENDIEITKKENMDKASESTLVSRCKREYHELKKKYHQLIAQNEFLNTNIKITKINEIKIEAQILQDELIKVTDLYHHSQNQNVSNERTINELIEFKDKFIVQHAIIEDLQRRSEIQRKEIEELRQEISKVNGQKNDIETRDKKLKIENATLQKQIEKLLNDKKRNEKTVMNQSDYEKKIKELQEKCEFYKKSSPKPTQPSTSSALNKMYSGNEMRVTNQLKEFTYETVKTVEVIPDSQLQEKNKLLQGIIKDYKMKINIYEAYLRKIHQDPELILKKGNYNSGVINTRSNIESNNFNINTTSDLRQSTQIEDLNSKIVNGNQTRQIETNNIIINNNTDVDNDLFVLRKSLEAVGVTQNMLLNDLNEIYHNFENKLETTKEDFLRPFVQMFSKHYKLEIDNDINFLNNFFSDLIEHLDNDTEQFYQKISEMFNKVKDYSNGNNLELQVKLLGKQLYPNKEYLLTSFRKIDQNNSGLITFQEMWNLLFENNLGLNADQIDLLFYLMKKNVPAHQSLFSLNYTIILTVLNSNSDSNDNNNVLATDLQDNKREDDDDNENGIEDDSINEMNKKALEGIFKAMIYSCSSFDQLFGEYIKEVNASHNSEIIRLIDCKDLEKVLSDNGCQLTKRGSLCFQSVYGTEDDTEQLDVNKIKEDVKLIPIESLEAKKMSYQLDNIEEEEG